MNNFDHLHNRKDSNSVKWNNEILGNKFGKEGILPFWVADMDFIASDSLISNLVNRAKHGFYGYEFRPDSIKEKIVEWCFRRHDWEIDGKDLSFAPNVLSAISILIELCSNKGDKIIIQPPVYYPFEETVKTAERETVYNRLVEKNSFYSIDFEDLKEKASDSKTKIMIMSSPHNPVGRVWTKTELEKIAQICLDENVLLISDEIHMEFVYHHHFFYTTALLPEKLKKNTVQLFSAGKTFNLSGNTIGISHFNDPHLQKQFNNFLTRFHLTGVNVFTTTALETVFSEGETWFEELIIYLEQNLNYISDRISKELPLVNFIIPEGTYLLWMDFSAYSFKGRELEELLQEKAEIALDPGRWFGKEYCSYARLNIGCSRALLEEALNRIVKVLDNHVDPD